MSGIWKAVPHLAVYDGTQLISMKRGGEKNREQLDSTVDHTIQRIFWAVSPWIRSKRLWL